MSDNLNDVTLPPYDNFILLETAYLLLHAANDIISNETGDLYDLLRACDDPEAQKQLRTLLELLSTAIGDAYRIMDILIRVDSASWNP